MLSNYFKTAWRNLIRGKSFSVINISGLAIGMAGAVLILLWIQNEVSFDKFHKNKDRLYEVYGLITTDGKLRPISMTSQPLGPALKEDIPEIESTSRFAEGSEFLLTAGEKRMTNIRGAIVDPAFLSQFSFPLVQSSASNPLTNDYSIAITEKLAKKLFGNEDALNKTIRIDSTDHFVVSAVLKDLPGNTRFNFEYLLPWSYLKKIGWNNDSWLSNNISTFVLLNKNANLANVNNQIRDFTRHKANQPDTWTHFLHPLSLWHLYGDFENGKPTSGRITTVRLFGVIATFILLIACINFMNLSTARSEKRAKEVGIRKVAGAGKGLLIRQFIIESFVLASVSGILALLIVQMTLMPFNALIDAQLFIPYTNPVFWLAGFTFIAFTSLLAGSYPAFYLASFKPVGIFQGRFKKAQALLSTRKVLVVLQFTFAIALIISTIVVREQIRYAQDRDKGFTGNNLLSIRFTGDIEKNYMLIKQNLLSDGIATSVTKTMANITQRGSNTWGLRWPGISPNDDQTIALYSTDAALVRTAGLHLIAGRDIDIYKYPSDSTAVMLNETAVKVMGFKDPVGATITQPSSKINWHVVGVVKDYMMSSPYEKVPPLVIEGPGSWFGNMLVQFSSNHSTAENLKKAEQVFRKYNTAYPFDYQFVNDDYAKHFDNEQRTKSLAGLFAGLSIFISCLGLFGLAAYIAEQRTKEIGIRKVLGATVTQLWMLLSRDFVLLVLVSCAIASPIAFYFLQGWLDQYAYRINIGVGVFVWAGLTALTISLVTVSFQAIKAAISNPSDSLRAQ